MMDSLQDLKTTDEPVHLWKKPAKRKRAGKKPETVQIVVRIDKADQIVLKAEAKRRGLTQGKMAGLAIGKFLRAQQIKRKLLKNIKH